MVYKILIHPKAKAFLNKLDKKTKERIKNKLKGLKKFPDKTGKHLKYSTFWSLRIGDYRAIYEIKEKKVIVLFIGHRKKIYLKTTKYKEMIPVDVYCSSKNNEKDGTNYVDISTELIKYGLKKNDRVILIQ